MLLLVMVVIFIFVRLRQRTWSSISDRNGDITTRTLELRGFSNRASAAIGRHWKIKDITVARRQICKNILTSKKFAKRGFLFRQKIIDFKLLSHGFERFLPILFCYYRHLISNSKQIRRLIMYKCTYVLGKPTHNYFQHYVIVIIQSESA